MEAGRAINYKEMYKLVELERQTSKLSPHFTTEYDLEKALHCEDFAVTKKTIGFTTAQS